MAIVCACLPLLRPIASRVSKSTVIIKLKAFALRPHWHGSRRWTPMNTAQRKQAEASDSRIRLGLALARDKTMLPQEQPLAYVGDDAARQLPESEERVFLDDAGSDASLANACAHTLARRPDTYKTNALTRVSSMA